jgi:Helix-turn-helix domain
MTDDIKRILDQPTCSVDDLRKIVGGSRNTVYEAVRRGDFSTIRVGRRYRVVTAPLKVKLGLVEAASPSV